MVVGYSLGNRSDVENDIQVLGEDDENVLTYSRSLPLILSRMCRNDCPYCGFHKKGSLVVPYSTIKQTKKARAQGIREALICAGERPDKYPHISALLELWGFRSYLDYVYTVCELTFLEGLIPVLEIGFLSPIEMKRLMEVCGLIKIMLDPVDDNHFDTIYSRSPGKKRELRLKSLEWAGKLKFPTITGIMVGIGETKTCRKEALNQIAAIHKQYGSIHEVLIQNFVPEPETPFAKKSTATRANMLSTVEMALNILPDDVHVVIPPEYNDDIEDFIKLGVKDLGRVIEGQRLINKQPLINIEDIAAELEPKGYTLQQRFPLRKEFIKEGMYSKKLGQVFESYKYKIKRETQDKLKEAKAGPA